MAVRRYGNNLLGTQEGVQINHSKQAIGVQAVEVFLVIKMCDKGHKYVLILLIMGTLNKVSQLTYIDSSTQVNTQ